MPSSSSSVFNATENAHCIADDTLHVLDDISMFFDNHQKILGQPRPDRKNGCPRADSELHTQQPKTSRISASDMVVRIRLARFGKRNAPFYNIVVTQAR